MYEKWTTQEDEILKSKYARTRLVDLEKFFPNRTGVAIKGRAKKLGIKPDSTIKKQRYNINESYFSIPNIENSYWAGVIATDGCVYKQSNNLEISINKNDICLLEDFKRCINFTGPIKIYPDKRSNTVMARIVISNRKEIIEALKKNWNIVPGKTYKYQFPKNLDYQCMLAFLKGFIDGDGCIYIRDEKYLEFNISSHLRYVLLDIKSFIDQNFSQSNFSINGGNVSKRINSKKDLPFGGKQKKYINYKYSVCGSQAVKFLTEVYKIISLGLARKWNKVQSIAA